MTSEEITAGELTRFMDRMERALSDLGKRIDTAMTTRVSTERYEAEMAEVRQDIARHGADVDAMLERQGKWKLAIFTAIVAPVIVSVLLIVLFAAMQAGQAAGG